MDGLTIVTGGAGFIGSHLVVRLVDSGRVVRVIDRPGAEVGHLPPQVEFVPADIRDSSGLNRAMAGAPWVFHLAANPNLWVRNREEFLSVNYQGTINVLDAALAAGAERVLHTSTESILTKASLTGPIDENVEITLKDTVGPYCRSKLLAEQYAFTLARRGLPVVVANPTMPVGPGDRNLSPPTRLILDFSLGRLPAALDCTLNLVDVRDVAMGLQRVMERGQPGRRYLLSGENMTLMELLHCLSQMTGVPAPRWRVPYPLGLLVAGVSELWADHVTGRAPKATLTGLRLARRILHFDASRSRTELELCPRSIRDSLADAVRWLQQSGQLPPGKIGPGRRDLSPESSNDAKL